MSPFSKNSLAQPSRDSRVLVFAASGDSRVLLFAGQGPARVLFPALFCRPGHKHREDRAGSFRSEALNQRSVGGRSRWNRGAFCGAGVSRESNSGVRLFAELETNESFLPVSAVACAHPARTIAH